MPISHSGKRPVICITMGDPRGIGPEVIEKALGKPFLKKSAAFIVIGKRMFRRIGPKKSAQSSVEYIKEALDLIRRKKADALVTGPVSKEAINRSGVKFKGHTEYLAKLSNCKKIAMMFTSDRLKVSLVTRHIAVKELTHRISSNLICDTVELTYKALKNLFGIKNPKIGISGFNPHCGEKGLFGNEERTLIKPALKRLHVKFRNIRGPIPADTLLYDTYHKRYDAAVCLYHDQGLTAFKMVSRDSGVNLTLGLPFIRTSPDHGTGFDIAGKGVANPGSMIEAIKLAIGLVKRC